MAEPAHRLLTYPEYLAIEETSEGKHEWLDGQVVAMSGGTPTHSALATNATIMLGVALRGRPCRPYNSDLRIRVPETGLATYPDCLVICGGLERHPEDDNAATNPSVIVEVLSPSTEAWDRGDKFRHYRELASLRDYLLVSQHARQVEHYQRQDDGTWLLRTMGPGQAVRLSAVEVALPIDELYQDVELTEAPPRPQPPR